MLSEKKYVKGERERRREGERDRRERKNEHAPFFLLARSAELARLLLSPSSTDCAYLHSAILCFCVHACVRA